MEFCSETGKRCYSQREAGGALKAAKKRRDQRKSRTIPSRVYFCQSCGAYHLTHYRQKFKKHLKGIKEYRKNRNELQEKMYDSEY